MCYPFDDDIVWLDMEMTGLDPDECRILEVACLITDKNLNIISDTFHLVLNQPEAVLLSMNEWCRQHHTKSGLYHESLRSTIKESQAEDLFLRFLKKHTTAGQCHLAGNTIYMDRLFLNKHFPRVGGHFHYRLIDVSSINELARRWYPNLKIPRKSKKHRAIDDIHQSITELKYYKERIFIPSSTTVGKKH